MQDWEKLVNEHMKDWHIKPSSPDERDWPLQVLLEPPKEMPQAASLKHHYPFVMNQEQNPYCGGYAGVGAANAYYNSIGKLPLDGFSASWLYWQAKEIDGLPGQNGTTLRAVLDAGRKVGLCPAYLCPTLPGNKKPVFTDVMYQTAQQYKIKAYARLNVGSLAEIQQAISSGRMVMVATIVTDINWNDGWIIEPEGVIAGGHATLQLAYDQCMQHQEKGKTYTNFATGANSWGTGWGFGGYYHMAEHYAQFKLTNFAMPVLMEAWAIEFDTPMQPKLPAVKRQFDAAPVIIDGRTMVELRSLAELAGVQSIGWDATTKKVVLNYPDKTATLYIGQKEYEIKDRMA